MIIIINIYKINIVLNNDLSKSLKADSNGIKNSGFSQISNTTNNINYKSVILNSRINDTNNMNNNKTKNKIKVLKD